MRDIRVAAAMMQAVVGDKQGNVGRIRALADEAASRGAELLVLPEACLTGYTVRAWMDAWTESVPGALTDAVVGIAADCGLLISAGLVEGIPGGVRYLTQFMAGPDGLIGWHRKTHLGPTETHLFTAGDSLEVMHAGGVCYGLQLCYEGHFPEISRTQALQGADVILIPHASPREEPEQKLERWLRYLPARAYDNSVFVVACNQTGENGSGLDFAGSAVILGPKGEILAQAAGTSPGLIVADLPARALEAVRGSRMGFFLAARRPGLYR